jgi:serine/threonine protein kinase
MASGEVNLQGQLVDAQYRVEDCIGRGGMGEVWRVRHVQSRQLFALKTIRSSLPHDRRLLRRLILEARATAAVPSSNVIRILDVDPDYVHEGIDLPYILMELLEGQSLAGFLARDHTLSPGELLWVMHQVSHALSLAHARGIVHRDLKPSNVFLARDEARGLVVKVCDFGIAKLQGSAIIDLAETGGLSTETGELLGTPRYMAPEQLRRAGREGPATDQWAFALIVFRALTGRSYFENVRNAAELILAIVHEPLPAPSSLSSLASVSFDDWFSRSCERDPDARFSSIEEQQLELERALGSVEWQAIDVGRLDAHLPARPTPREPFHGDSATSRSVDHAGQPRWLAGVPFYACLAAAAVTSILTARWLARQLTESLAETQHTALQAEQSSISHVVSTDRANADKTPRTDTADTHDTAGDAPSLVPMPASTMVQVPTLRAGSTGVLRGRTPSRPRHRLLPAGAACTRSSECEGNVCAAEVCQ